MSDRIKISNKALGQDVILSPQVLINCGGGGSCGGGNPGGVFEYMAEYGLPSETCQNYEAVNGECKPYGVCETCEPGESPKPFLPGTCTPIQNYTRWGLDGYGLVLGGSNADRAGQPLSSAEKIKAALMEGPIACGIHVTKKFQEYSGGIFSELNPLGIMSNHELALVGWGVDDSTGEEYWIGRNSWGTYWGEQGFFRITNKPLHNLGIETQCSWATPVPMTRTVDAKATPTKRRFHPAGAKHLIRSNAPVHVKTPMPSEYLKPDDLPKSYDIRNLNGKSYASIDRNQHIPQYCGSCWTMSTSSSLSDRIKLARDAAFPEIDIAPQVLVDCVKANSSNGCSGGDPTAAYSYIYENGITDETCSNYRALDGTCEADNICRNCEPGKGCFAQKQHATYEIEEHGQVQGVDAMMAEIAARGPIACGVCVTEEFENFDGNGVFVDKSGCTEVMHAISIAGYGTTEDGVDYWILRNSWGTYWADNGWALIKRGVNTLGLESTACDWAVPKKTW
jgi:cathepsin X